MKTCVSIGALLFVACTFLSAQKSPLWGDLQPGNYNVGFKIITLQDQTRLNKEEQPRTIQIHLWYPAAAVKENKLMPFKEYLQALSKTQARLNDTALKIYLKNNLNIHDEAAIRLLNTATTATASAEHAEGQFPLLIWGFRNSTTAYQAVISEYLASHGYLVAFVHPQGLQPVFRWNQTSPDFNDIAYKLYDIEFALGYLNNQSFTDQHHTGVLSWSYGGETAILLQMQNASIDLAIFLDAFDKWCIENAAKSPFFDAAKATIPYISFADNYDSTTLKLLQEFKYNELKLHTYAQTKHGNFNSLESIIPFLYKFDPPRWTQGGEPAKIAYELICRYTLAYLNHYFKQQALQIPTASAPDILVKPQTFHPSALLAPSDETLVTMGLKNELDQIRSIFAQFPELYGELTYTYLADRLLSDFRFEDALHLFELNVKLFPQSPEILMTMANTYLLFERKQDAKSILQELLIIHPKHEAATKLLQEINK
ncbi:MAG: hypothetical protein SFU99_17775 [Saprospiraceae bacterium]|nr:hypothetical protein [Saprospiraceae bacterium]